MLEDSKQQFNDIINESFNALNSDLEKAINNFE